MENMEKLKRVHLIGAGGIGLSALGKYFRHLGIKVSGSDARANEATEEMKNAGVKISIGHAAENIPDGVDLVVYSDAVPIDNPERQKAAELGVKSASYFEMLGELSQTRETIGVSGTNGKSTTTSMLGLILAKAAFDPMVIVGSKVSSFSGRNFRPGDGVFVVEACEYRANMLKLSPRHIVLTDIREDHLDYYRNLKHIRDTFQEYVDKLPEGGRLVWNADDAESRKLKKKDLAVSYGFADDADYRVTNWQVEHGRQRFTITRKGIDLGDFSLAVPGRHNVMNATAAAAMALELGADTEAVREALAEYAGIWRRFEVVGERHGVLVVSDYAHHPDAVVTTIRAARDFYPGRRIVVCFQPHQRSRTRKLFDGFARAFNEADMIVLCEIFDVAGREETSEEISSRMLSEAVIAERAGDGHSSESVIYAENTEDALIKTSAILEPGDVLLIMGAGDIYRIADRI